MEPMTRIELVTSPLPRGCSTAKLHGRTPSLSLSQAVFLRPPNVLRTIEKLGRSWIRTSVGFRQRVYSPSPLATRTSAHQPVMGFEPATYGLQNRCSAVELHRRVLTDLPLAQSSDARLVERSEPPHFKPYRKKRRDPPFY